ncbi:hypothetical protein ACJMK2_005126 [Sinanodonta woodiana]|uniref:F-box/LRR-repeat protein 15-like leucin rich repeat domain-containing protein n=1 Tax=Sinanodonta woodiana TaxID=1069815 RepID=A0ABD3VS40_SINWO
MVKSLVDICLSRIQKSLDLVSNAGRYLPRVYKEILIQRIAAHDQLTENYLPYVSYNLFSESVRKIDFYRCGQITDKVLELISSSRCKLDELTIHGCNQITDKGFIYITQSQDQLVKLRFRKMRGLTNKGLNAVRSSQLQRLDLTGCFSVTFAGACEVVCNNPTIRDLILRGIEEKGDHYMGSRNQDDARHNELITMISKLSHNLEELDCELFQLNDECLECLGQFCPNLKKLNLHGCVRFHGEALIKLSIGCNQLQNLDLSYCGVWQEHEREALWTLPTSLTHLSLCGVLLNDKTILTECLQRLKRLKSVRLCGVPALDDSSLEKILQYIGAGLLELDLSGGQGAAITDAGLAFVTQYCIRLESLAISLLRHVTGISLIPIFQNPERAACIRSLFLSVRNLDSEMLFFAAESCLNLERLEVSGVFCVNDELLFSLSEGCPHLEDLGLKGCTQVTDEGVCRVAQSCPLKKIVLAGINNLTDRSIITLANNCHMLHEIYLNGCYKVSELAIRYLVDCCIPRLYYRHVTPNANPNQLMAKNLDTGQYCQVDGMVYNGL